MDERSERCVDPTRETFSSNRLSVVSVKEDIY